MTEENPKIFTDYYTEDSLLFEKNSVNQNNYVDINKFEIVEIGNQKYKLYELSDKYDYLNKEIFNKKFNFTNNVFEEIKSNNIGDKFKEKFVKINDGYNKKILYAKYLEQKIGGDLSDKYGEYVTPNYLTHLNNIKIEKYEKDNYSDNDYNKKYIKNFCRQIYSNISRINYPGEELNDGMERDNHGALNHFRSLKFGIKYLTTIIDKIESDNLKKIFPDHTIILIILSTFFESLLRIDENPSSYVLSSLKTEYYNDLYNKLNGDLNDGDLNDGYLSIIN